MTTTVLSNDDLRKRAQALSLYGLIDHFDELATEQLAWLSTFIEWEETERQRRSLERRLRNARLGSFKILADYDWSWPNKCDREVIEDLCKLRFVNEGANAVLLGPNGVGKTMIAKNIAHQAVLAGHTVTFVTAG